MMNNVTPLIIDFDPGLDDAVCFFMILGSKKFDVLGVCPVSGNKGLEITESNALKLCELVGREDIPVLRGASKGILKGRRTSGNVHGSNGLGRNVVLPDPTKKVEKEYAWDFVYRKAVEYNGALEILAVGPLTNLGIAFIKYPELHKLIKRIVIMGGGFARGNWTAAAEFNIWADPDAARIVFESGVPMAMMGLDICEKAIVSKEDLSRLDNGGKISRIAADLMRDRIMGRPEMTEEQRKKHKGGIVCDAVAACYMIDPECIETEYVEVRVETKGTLTEGKTYALRPFTETETYNPNTFAGVSIDRDRFGSLLVETIANLD